MPSKKTKTSGTPLGIIGGSSLARLENLEVMRRRGLTTPYGKLSSPLAVGTMAGRQVIFLARHGEGHAIPPHEVNYRANIWALRAQEVKTVVAVATVGGIRADLEPGTLVVP